jgi:hypothetical protein
MKCKNTGFVIAGAITFLILIAFLAGAQLFMYQQHMLTLNSQLEYNQAVILRNVSIAKQINDQQIMQFKQGKVQRRDNLYQVTFVNGRSIELNSPIE